MNTHKHTLTSHFKTVFWPFIVGLFFLIGINMVLKISKGEPDSYTELYFNNHTSLPVRTISSEAYGFDFTIHNFQHRNMTYPYEVYMETDTKKVQLSHGSITLAHNELKTTPVKFVARNDRMSKITVNLLEQNQQIGFWITSQ